jgi:hypothetical protein
MIFSSDDEEEEHLKKKFNKIEFITSFSTENVEKTIEK